MWGEAGAGGGPKSHAAAAAGTRRSRDEQASGAPLCGPRGVPCLLRVVRRLHGEFLDLKLGGEVLAAQERREVLFKLALVRARLGEDDGVAAWLLLAPAQLAGHVASMHVLVLVKVVRDGVQPRRGGMTVGRSEGEQPVFEAMLLPEELLGLGLRRPGCLSCVAFAVALRFVAGRRFRLGSLLLRPPVLVFLDARELAHVLRGQRAPGACSSFRSWRSAQ